MHYFLEHIPFLDGPTISLHGGLVLIVGFSSGLGTPVSVMYGLSMFSLGAAVTSYDTGVEAGAHEAAQNMQEESAVSAAPSASDAADRTSEIQQLQARLNALDSETDEARVVGDALRELSVFADTNDRLEASAENTDTHSMKKIN